MELFYLWWLMANGLLYCAEYDFLLRFTDAKRRCRRHLFLYIGVNSVLTFCTIYFQMSGFLSGFFHTAVLCYFFIFVVKIKWNDLVAPAAIIFTLSAIMDGISTLVMWLLVVRVSDRVLGNAFHVMLTIVLIALFYAALRLVARRYRFTAKPSILPYLYSLLFPCAFVAWVIRFGFGLDNRIADPSLAPFAVSPPLWTFVCIAGALATFFIILEIFRKIVDLSDRETEKALLDAQLREQRLYLAEAGKRDDQYRSFQHDINNHLLILSGLFQEGKYDEVDQYFSRLNAAAGALLSHISTGSSVLDVLLSEKIRYAEQNGISVSCTIELPSRLFIDSLDLSVVFSNALDNAIEACLQESLEDRSIRVKARARHQILLIEVTNTCHSGVSVKPDTGLKNMKHIAEKYQGTMDFEKSNGIFRLSLLLCWNDHGTTPSA